MSGRADIDAAVSRLSDDSRLTAGQAVRRLADHLRGDEGVRALACAGIDCLAVVTDERFVLLETPGDGSDDIEVSFRWDEVESVEVRAAKLTLTRVHDPAEGAVSRVRRFYDRHADQARALHRRS